MLNSKHTVQKKPTLNSCFLSIFALSTIDIMNKNRILTLVIFSLLSISVFSQRRTYLSQAVNLAGKQRMLGQRMAKDKMYAKAGVKEDFAKKEMRKAIEAFKYGLGYLKEFAPTQEIKHKIDIQEFAFKYYLSMIESNSRSSIQDVINSNTLFLAVCDDVVTSLIKYAKIKNIAIDDKNQSYVIENIAKATGASGKLRYLTQRLTLYYALNRFKIKTVTPKDIDTIVKTMEKNLNYLTVLEFNTLQIDDSLSEVLYYWNELKSKIYTKEGIVDMNSKRINTVELLEICNNVLNKANTTTKMYADLNKS